jgi:hypothetical protein
MKFSLQRYKIDWPNHTIGFFSALFGILIAFQLDDWREERNQAALAHVAFVNLQKEVQDNQTTLHENINNNLNSLHSLQNLLPRMNDRLQFTGTRTDADSLNSNFGNIVFINVRDQTNRDQAPQVFIGMGNINIPSLQSTAWESAKATGALNLMNYEKVLCLSFVYNNPRLMDELAEVRSLWRTSDDIRTKAALSNLLFEMEKSHKTLEEELQEYDKFVNILNAME